ncbi:SDR family oxidoreductase [Geminicoccus roseus]|uniref:SDR family oxidoreductase n=1 Tax=Geminicoccus roseus TaxID=404900 RepID=UPI00041675EA|nr:SDR family oxidoreductase [Geminicoccus roseus]
MAVEKIALITGGGSGVGRSTALALAKAGWSVVVAGRRQEQLDGVVQELGTDKALGVATDVSDDASVQNLFAKIKERFGRLDLLFNNAGTFGRNALLEELTYDDWKAVVDANLTGSFLCTREAFKLMKDQDPQGGRIINNGSISAHVPRPNSIAYTATKHAVTGLTRSTSLDGRKYNIACGQIDIGNAASEMTKKMDGGVPQADGSIKPEPKIDAAHVADTIVHMASLPLDANVQFVTVMATKMPFIGRG